MTDVPPAVLDEALVQLLCRERGEAAPVDCAGLLTLSHAELTEEEAREACRQARRLLDAAFDVAGDFRDERIDLGEATARLERDHPGFGEASYASALGWGLFESR